jgi:uncharacterized protein (TIGR02594 family)
MEAIMERIQISAFDLAQRFIGVKSVNGAASNAQVLAMLQLVTPTVNDDDVPWCSAFMNYIAWLLRLPRSKNLLARSWLSVGVTVGMDSAEVGFDVVILKRKGPDEPGPENLTAFGHVGLYAGREGDLLWVLGGNQNETVSITTFPVSRLLGIRRLKT